MENVWIWLYMIIINILGLLMFGYDKVKAKRNGWRIPEKRFFVIGLLGGATGIYFGMQVFRHKTQHKKFTYGIPFLIIVNLVVLYVFFRMLMV